MEAIQAPFENKTHPGEILLDELKARRMRQSELAVKLSMPRSQLNEVIKGKRGINADLAIRLERVLGIPARYWLEGQMRFDLYLARKKSFLKGSIGEV